MMRMIMLGIISLIIFTSPSLSQSNSFYIKGYIVKNTDTIPCSIWYDPVFPNFQGDITIWLNQEAKTLSFENDRDLISFGITEKGYEADYGRIRRQGLSNWIQTFAKKIVTGIVEIYELPFDVIKKAPDSYGLNSEAFVAYFISRSDTKSFEYPTLLKKIKRNKIEPFVNDYPGLNEIPEVLTPELLVDLAIKYNTWHKSK